MKGFVDFTRGLTKEELAVEEQEMYYKEVEWAWDKIITAEKLAAEMARLRIVDPEEHKLDRTNKLNDTYQAIQREKERNHAIRPVHHEHP